MNQMKTVRATVACYLIALYLLGSPGLHVLKNGLLQGVSTSECPSLVCCECHRLPTSPPPESAATFVDAFEGSYLPCSIGKLFAKKILVTSIAQPVLSFLVVPFCQEYSCRLFEQFRCSHLARGPPPSKLSF